MTTNNDWSDLHLKELRKQIKKAMLQAQSKPRVALSTHTIKKVARRNARDPKVLEICQRLADK